MVNENKGLDSRISPMYGRAPYIALVDIGPNGNIVAVNITPNPAINTQRGAGQIITQYILSSGASIIIASNMKPHIHEFLKQYGIQVITVPPGIPLRQALKSIGVIV